MHRLGILRQTAWPNWALRIFGPMANRPAPRDNVGASWDGER
jgi:hypothetical protein